MKFYGRESTKRTQRCLYTKWVRPYRGKSIHELIEFWKESDLKMRTIKSLISLAARDIEERTGERIKTSHIIRMLSREEQDNPIEVPIKEELIRFFKKCKTDDPELYLPSFIALNTGMRRGEVWGLEWENIDFIKGIILINNSYGKSTKNGKSRIVKLNKQLEAVLLDQTVSDSYNNRRVIPKIFDPNPRIRGICKKEGIKPFTFHAFRHAFATFGLESGKSPKLIQEALGHSHVSTTLNLYWASNRDPVEIDFIPEEGGNDV